MDQPRRAKRAAPRPPRRTQEERRTLTRDRLINAVIEVIRQKGYAGLRARDVTATSGVTWGAAQHLFGDKNELLLQVATRVSDSLVQQLDARPEARGGDLRQRVATVVNLIWEVYSSQDYFAMVEIVRGTRADVRFHEKLVESLARLSTRIERLWLDIFEDAAAGEAQSLACCNIVVLTLSGLAARKIYLRLGPQTDAILEELIDSIAASLRSARKTTGTSRASARRRREPVPVIV
ncbi:TetR/AcrR family transcriptional regulator [Peristeroidobacter soli]|jgi:AcrR family transcriptional regulator|uniref:TetR/AcrR family transcriptional regulator n=1 Tax=Peristeroidobacter soli TaxID=2497877 RepID=UPI00101C5445|nr:TetR/AcrR family transcriptional regulator [Peristeroidobacter soli]